MAVSHQGSPALPEGKAMTTRRAMASAEGAAKAVDADANKSVESTPQAADQQAKLGAEEANAPPRRNSGRTRKIPSRLLSPSPPPSKPSNYYNPSKVARGSTAERGSAVPPSVKPAGRKSMPASSSTEDVMAVEPLGPGKRKRRPSSMSGLPTAITCATDAPATSSVSPTKAATSASTGVKAKARLSSKSNSPGPRDAELSGSTSGTTPSGAKPRKSASSTKRQPSLQPLAEAPSAAAGYESDGGAPEPLHHIKIDQEEEDEIDLLGPVSAKKLRQGSTSNASMATAASSLLTQVFDPPPLLGRTGTLLTTLGDSPRQPVVASSLKLSRPRTYLAPLEAQARGRGLHGSDPASHFARYNAAKLLQASQNSAAGEESEAEDEDDFHKAMLDGGEFDTLDDDELMGRAGSWGSKGACSSDAESTPATTPRSPQSNCDARDRKLGHETPNPYPRGSTDSNASTVQTDQTRPTSSPKGKERAREGATVTFNEKATVFAHALPPASREPGTSAGSLTLSLPYDDEAANTIRASAVSSAASDSSTVETTSVGIGLTVPGSDGGSSSGENALLSPGQALLGLHSVSKLAAGASSPFGLASVVGPSSPAPLQLGASMWSQDSSDGRDSHSVQPTPPGSSRLAALVAEAAASKPGDASEKVGLANVSGSRGVSTADKRRNGGTKQELEDDENDDDDDDEWLAGSSGSISPHSSLSARMEERDEEDLYHLAGAPEAMCLSELDRAWDTSERVEAYKAYRMADVAAAAAAATDSSRRGGSQVKDEDDADMADDAWQVEGGSGGGKTGMEDPPAAQDEIAMAVLEEEVPAALDDAESLVKTTPISRRSSRGAPSSLRCHSTSTQRSSKIVSSISPRRSSSPAAPLGPVALRSGKRGSLSLEEGISNGSAIKRTTRSGAAANKEIDTSPSVRRSRRVAS